MCPEHSHSLDESNANKRNSLLRKLVRAKVTKGYYPAAVIRLLTGKGRAKAHVLLAAASSTYLTRQDAINSTLV